MKLLGEGSYGKVFEANDKVLGCIPIPVVIKVSKRRAETQRKEASVLMYLNSKQSEIGCKYASQFV